ncbi:MAG: acyltransferase family protein [Roseobacter sp.]
MTLGDAFQSPRSQNLNLLRLLLAMSVILSHAWPLALGPGTLEPLELLTGRSLGGWAVGVFFFISGMLITASAARTSPRAFWIARAKRILPGLSLALFVTLALALSSGSTVMAPEAATWFLRAITLISIEHRLPDAFASNPYPEVVNGPLWSLSHEVFAYVICASFVWIGGARRPHIVWLLVLLASTMCLMQDYMSGRLATFAPLFCAFSFGVAAYIWRDKICLQPASIAGIILLAAVLPQGLAAGVVGLGLVALMLRLPRMRLKSDASYGLYIYGWPIAQMIVACHPGIAPLHLGVTSILATYPMALLSWHLVEQPNRVPHRTMA